MSSIGAETLTYESWLALPETKVRHEIVDGVLRMPPGRTAYHQRICLRLVLRLHQFVEERGLGLVLHAPVDLLIQRQPLRVRQPDVLFLNAARTGIRNDADLIGLYPLDVTPDLVVEVRSPSNTGDEIEGRLIEAPLNDYWRIGVPECWLVDPASRSVNVLALSSEGSISETVFGLGVTVDSRILIGFAVPVDEIFGASP